MFDTNVFIEQRAEQANISCRTFIVTIFGDLVSQHGHWIWLGSLIETLRPMGFSERLVRTSVFRLVKEDWLEVKKVGRKSFYRFTETANNHYTRAAKRIYSGDSRVSENNWLILMPSFVEETKLVSLKKQLHWLGFSSIAGGVFAHPNCDIKSLEDIISELELEESIIIFSAKTNDTNSAKTLRKLVHNKWQLEALQQRYQALIDVYSPIKDLLKSKERLNDQQCLSLRILLVHEYRRILLTDHELAEEMLPTNWKGHIANQLVESIYEQLSEPSTRYICSNLLSVDGYLSNPSSEFSKRFKSHYLIE